MKTLIITGAGISLASGIPTFRGSDPGAVWANDVLEMGTVRYFRRNPVKQWQWYRSRFLPHAGAKPNAAHHAIADWEKKERDFLLVTQNVDTLHEQAGSQRLVHAHGSMDKVRCARRGCKNGAPYGTMINVDFTSFDATPKFENLPRCPICRALIRPHALWFDEYYDDHESYQIDRVVLAAQEAELVVFAGTSFAVGLTTMVMREACVEPRGRAPAKVLVIDPNPLLHPFEGFVTQVREKAEEWFPKHVASLKGEAETA